MANVQQHASGSDAGDFFVKSPLFSLGFVANTSILIFCLGVGLFLTFKYWNFVWHGSWLFLAWGAMFTSWRLALVNRGRISELFEAGVIAGIEPGSPLETSLEVASDTLNRVLGFSFGANMVFLGAIIYLLRHSCF
ncbi:MAG TPA: hypothetical protein VKS20_07605 [Candidatus Acidoferrales bacterium]|nr:hypothetical protein [Candidatus Acidoferrales bacterium]